MLRSSSIESESKDFAEAFQDPKGFRETFSNRLSRGEWEPSARVFGVSVFSV